MEDTPINYSADILYFVVCIYFGVASLCMYIYIYIYIGTCECVCVCVGGGVWMCSFKVL
jgi:hypothetical protein